MSASDEDSNHGYGPAPDDPVAFDASEENYGRGRLVLLLFVVMVAGVLGLFYVVYQQGARSRHEPAIITAETQPEKVAPEDPGGAVIEHQDKFVYDQISGTEEPQVEVLMPKAEEPMDLAGLRKVATGEIVVETGGDIPAVTDEETGSVPVPERKPETKPTEKSVETLIEETTTPEPTPQPTSVSTQSAVSGAYVVQVGAYDQSSLAAAAWDTMSQKHASLLASLRPDIQVADLGAKGTWYRLRVGPFSDKDGATQLCGRLKSAGQDCLVRKP